MPELKTASVPVFVHQHVGGEAIDVAGFPYMDALSGTEFPVVTEHVGGGSNGILSSPSQLHGRSYVINLSALTGDEVQAPEVWQDAHGNAYSAVSTKGNNLAKPGIFKSRPAPSGFLPFGLQEGDAMLRIKRSSDNMRAAGIDTEWPLIIAQPQQLIHTGEHVSVTEYKKRLIAGLATGPSGEDPNGDRRAPAMETSEISETALVLNSMEFFFTVRATSAAERLSDVIKRAHLDKDKLGAAINTYNILAPYRTSTLEELGLPRVLDSIDPDSATLDTTEIQYFTEIVPKLIASNLAKLHTMGLIHRFPHLGNVTVVGGLVDLDSVSGEKLDLGDKPLTPADYANDLRQIIEGIREAYEALDEKAYGEAFTTIAIDNFLTQYITSRGYDVSRLAEEPDLLEIILSIPEQTGAAAFIEKHDLMNAAVPGMLEMVEEALANSSTFNMAVTTEDIAKTVYWNQVEDSEANIWLVALDQRDGEDPLILRQDDVPGPKELEAALLAYLGTDIEHGKAFGSGVLSFVILPYIEEQLKSQETSLDNIAEQILTTLTAMDRPNPPKVSADLVNSLVYQEILKRIGFKAPPPEDFAASIKQVFREKYLDRVDVSVIPEQELLALQPEDLKPYEYFWDFLNKEISHAYIGVPETLITPRLSDKVQPQATSSETQLLTAKVSRGEHVRLLLTDGKIDDLIIDDHYPRYCQETGDSTGATYAVFLIHAADGTFRIEHNILSQHDGKLTSSA